MLLEQLAELSVWRTSMFEKKMLPLPHFTKLSVIMSKLFRIKAHLSSHVSWLLMQVRALLVEAVSEEAMLLKREIQLRTRDPSIHLEEEIEHLTNEIENMRIALHERDILAHWERLLSTLEFKLHEERMDKLGVKLCKHIGRVKNKVSVEAILRGEELSEDEGEDGEKKGSPSSFHSEVSFTAFGVLMVV